MVQENLKRKKKHDRDKYYYLAKEQGYRSRAAFKLIQINRKYDFLSKSKVCIDLCAAPGGWCQVAAKFMPHDSIILGVDLLPIRAIPRVKTLVQDITTVECRNLLKKEMKGFTADVVLCDGAPNVGTMGYGKDAFVQNEIALAAVKVATEHLGKGGYFVTKVYRSRDYNALMWIFNTFFDEVQAIKPSSSRQQSAEIFVLCSGYKAPRSIDPKLLDPRHVFKEVEESKPSINVFHDQYGKQKRNREGYDDDLVEKQLLLRKVTVTDFINSNDPIQMLTVNNFIYFDQKADKTESEEEVNENEQNDDNSESLDSDEDSKGKQPRRKNRDKMYFNHPLTSEEIKTCLADLKVLGKADFKGLLKWRLKMIEFRDKKLEPPVQQPEDENAMKNVVVEEKKILTEEEEEQMIQEEIKELQTKKQAANKRLKKKEREVMAKQRTRVALGMHHQSFEASEDAPFSLKSIPTDMLSNIRKGAGGDLKPKRRDGDMSLEVGGFESDEFEESSEDEHLNIRSAGGKDRVEKYGKGKKQKLSYYIENDELSDSDEENYKLEEELEGAYIQYLRGRDDKRQSGTKLAKRSKKAITNAAAEIVGEDLTMYDGDLNRYTEILTDYDNKGVNRKDGETDSDTDSELGDYMDGEEEDPPMEVEESVLSDANSDVDSDSLEEVKEQNSDSDDDDEEEMEEIHQESIKQGKNRGIVYDGLPEAIPSKSARVERWLGNKTLTSFSSELNMMEQEELPKKLKSKQDEKQATKKTSKLSKSRKDKPSNKDLEDDDENLTPEVREILESIPKTDKQIRHEKRMKIRERNEFRKDRRARALEALDDINLLNHEEENEEEKKEMEETLRQFENDSDNDDAEFYDENGKYKHLSAEEKTKILAKRDLIRKGMGQLTSIENMNVGSGKTISKASKKSIRANDGIELVPEDQVGTFTDNEDSDDGEMVNEDMLEEEDRNDNVFEGDDRKYDSENEDWDEKERAETLALATMMLRKSRAKKLIDASYNRYAWNDAQDLPEWFVDDEQRHYRPQVPIPKVLLDEVSEKFKTLANKPIKKVAEARLRKRKRAQLALANARSKASSIQANPDMTEREKLKAIEKALSAKGMKTSRPSKVYAVASKNGRKSFGKGGKPTKGTKVKLVDKRLKSDKRGLKNAEKKRSGKGKKGKR